MAQLADIANYDHDYEETAHLEGDDYASKLTSYSDNYDELTVIESNRVNDIDDTFDINEAFDDILFLEEKLGTIGFQEGYHKGVEEGNVEGYHLGYHRGAELGAELGYYSGIVDSYLERLKDEKGTKIDKIFKNLVVLQSLIVTFPRENCEEVDIIDLMDNIRCLYKKVCSSLKISSIYPEADKMNF